jgi:hypothetical protein
MVHGLQHYGAMLQLFVYARQAFHEQMHSHPTEMEKLLQAKFLFNYSNCFLGRKSTGLYVEKGSLLDILIAMVSS